MLQSLPFGKLFFHISARLGNGCDRDYSAKGIVGRGDWLFAVIWNLDIMYLCVSYSFLHLFHHSIILPPC